MKTPTPTPTTTPNAKPRRVDFLAFDDDYECAFLGAMGFSTRFITSRTRLTPGKVTYRLRKAHIRRIDYRDGASDFAVIMLRGMRPALDKNMHNYLEKL